MKKTLSMLLAVVLVLGLAIPSMAANTSRSDYEAALVGTNTTVTDRNAIKLEFQVHGPLVGGTQQAMVKYNMKQLDLITPLSGSIINPTATYGAISDTVNYDDVAEKAPNKVQMAMPNVYGKTIADDYAIVAISVDVNGGIPKTTCASGLTGIGAIYFGLKDGVSYDDLNNKSIQWCTSDEAGDCNQNCVLYVNDGSVDIGFRINNTTNNEFATAPGLTYTGSDREVATPITDITLSLDKTTVNVDGTTGGTVTVTATKVPADATKDVTLTVSGAAGAKGVSISGNTITIDKAATAGTYTVTAKGDAVTKTTTFTVTRAASVAKTVAVNPTSGKVTLKADGSAPAVLNATVTVTDQYGDSMTGATITPSGLPAGASWAANKFTFTNALRAGASTVTFTSGTASKTFALTVEKAAAPAAPTGLVGTKVSAIGANDGTITGVTTNMEYRKGTSGTYTACTGTTITGLSEGSYQVRLKETDFANASANATVTVGVPGQTDKPTVTVSASSTTIPDGGDVTLTANVTPATGTITYQWNKDGAPISGATNQTLTATEAGSYTCTVTRQADGETVSDPATSDPVKLTVKTVPVATVTKKATASQKTGTLKTQNLVTVDGAAWADVSSAVKATVYREVVAEDGTKTYEKVTGSLEVGTYYVDVAVTALATDDFKLDAVAGVGDAPTDATLNQFVKLTVTKASNGSIGGGSSSGGSDSIEYTVTYDAGKHGKLDGASTETVKRGETPSKVPTVVPDNGYKFVGWTRNDKAVNPAATQIKSSVTFVATYEAAVDVNRYIEGVSDTSFAPNANATRGQLAAMLARLSKGFDKNASYTSNAPDVAANAWYTDFVNFAIQEGIMNGYEDGTFRPTANITRGEFAAMLARYVGLSEIEGDRFGDMVGNWANGYVNALAQAGIVDGFEDGTFKGNDLLTRAQAVKMINIAINMKYDASANYAYRFDDVASSAWYYSYVMPAANLDVAPYQK